MNQAERDVLQQAVRDFDVASDSLVALEKLKTCLQLTSKAGWMGSLESVLRHIPDEWLDDFCKRLEPAVDEMIARAVKMRDEVSVQPAGPLDGTIVN